MSATSPRTGIAPDAAGNSAGDCEMLECAYAGGSVTNPGAEPILDTAARFGWTVVSMRDDRRDIFKQS